jgi:hypothetical protein
MRAEQLADPVVHRRLARALRGVVGDLDRPPVSAIQAAVPVRHTALMPWREALLGLAERLEGPGPVNPRGVARLRVLLTDGLSPLYISYAGRTIGDAIWWVADGLAPCPPHDWGCPVIMKLQPDHVAWTCQRCGAIATTMDRAVKPA